MDMKLFKEKLFKRAKEAGFEEVMIYFSDKESLSIGAYQGEIEKYNVNNTFQLSFKGKYKDKMGEAYTEIIDEESIDMLINTAKNVALSIESDDEQFIYEGDENYEKVITFSEDIEGLGANQLIDIALQLEDECKKYSDKVKSFGGCQVSYMKVNHGMENSKGLSLSSRSNNLLAYVVPIIEIDGEKIDGMGYRVVTNLNDIDPKAIAKEGVDEALSRVGGGSIPSGTYSIIIKNEAMVSLLGAFISVFGADAAQKGLSLLKDKEGDVIGSSGLNIVDNPLIPYGLGSAAFDDDGVATFKKDIVRNGKLITLMHNLKTANKAGCKSTGNAQGGGVGPTNIYIEKGKTTYEELLENINDGYLITEFAGLHAGANSITGDFSLAAKGFLIKNGKQDAPIEQFTVSGNFFTLLNNIELIGKDLKFPMSNIGSPSVKVNNLSIAGK